MCLYEQCQEDMGTHQTDWLHLDNWISQVVVMVITLSFYQKSAQSQPNTIILSLGGYNYDKHNYHNGHY